MTNLSGKWKIKVRKGVLFPAVYWVQNPEGVDVFLGKYPTIPEAYDRVLREIRKAHAPHLGHDLPETGRSQAHP